ncbi:murein L,D-transpeptidase catalytic domain family protein [Chitinophaga pendula]|uniref:murein L,D-transpeptidase catalytic domain family protein n=1 Tax=Chitinophaga TaxID=79328 RepID=UPI000BAFD730|nr:MULTISPECIES: murein L,D-transpeptidase catalytic domain family protein [Chitinophaga]ASZ13009.1 hypothetical protein CK934_19620 [Chitinophaga sp. MD30]UCJ09360.1 murein L,D-transpeptidase catalytic domain family protein [Chitinophaga pendula]
MIKPDQKKIRLVAFCVLFSTLLFQAKEPSAGHVNEPVVKKVAMPTYTTLYDSLKLDSLGLSRRAYDYAIQGYERLKDDEKLANKQLLSIVDFSLPSSKKRLFILDLETGALLFNTFVSHGRNSGRELATAFSNAQNSFMSSLGFYVTGATYKGEHGYSLKLIGEEKGINDNALSRGIVMHSADYVNEALINSQGYIGRSLGCPAIPISLHKKIIEKIRNGSCLFLYSPDTHYLANSQLLSHSDMATRM